MDNSSTFARQSLSSFVFWWWLGFCLVLFVFYQSLIPAPVEVGQFEYSDKVGHFLIYFILMSWFIQLYQRRRHLRLLFLFIAMGVVIEILQGQTTYRLFEFGDITANTLGVLFAWVLASTAYATLLLRTEKNVLFSNQRL